MNVLNVKATTHLPARPATRHKTWPAALLLTLGAATAQAQGLQGSYSVVGSAAHFSPVAQNQFSISQASPVTQVATISKGITNSGFSGPGEISARASADAGLLDLSVQGTSTSVMGPGGSFIGGGFMLGFASARASFTDFIVSTTIPDGATVQASVNGTLVYTGTITDNTSANIGLKGVDALVTVPGLEAFKVTNSLASQAFTSPLFTVPVGVPFAMSMSLGNSSSQAVGASDRPAGLTETVNVSASLSLGLVVQGAPQALAGSAFSASGPVFNLPDGYTLSSVQANIVNNQWLGPTLPVPEPGTAMLASLGALGLWLRLRRHTA